ncbi:MAG: LOW QUALITY PROTEIN: hypothetical protein JOS17DRAFT_731884 [Linnemannia elongata]|nr:MAG: LOW QUALITY PROTEIN: hypothetical protein JOS17DRAFT_731884 [Linnemannia elongata]
MSSLACLKFFEVPELVEQVRLFLRPHDLAQLLRTSRDLYAATSPLFWQYLDLEDKHRVDRLLASPAAFDLLAKNTPFVRTLKAGVDFFFYYYQGYLDDQEGEEEDETMRPRSGTSRRTTSDTRIQRPLWLPRPFSQFPPACPLPPMNRLTQLDVRLPRRCAVSASSVFSNGFPLLNLRPLPDLLPLAWLMTLNASGLKRVTLRNIYPPSPLEFRCLARSLSNMANLTHFRIYMPIDRFEAPRLTAPMVPLLFFACPKSLVSLTLEAEVGRSRDDDYQEHELRVVQAETAEQEGENGDGDRMPSLDWAEGDLMPREERLENLRELRLPTFSMGYSGDDIGRIMEHCPGLESWNIPIIKSDDAAEALYRLIGETVQRQQRQGQESRHLRHLNADLYSANCRGDGWIGIINALPEQYVESVTFDWYLDAFPDKFVPALLRHSEVLRSVIFKNSQKVESRTLATILAECRGLETFWTITQKRDWRKDATLEVGHATEQEWACEKIKSLRFKVDLAVREHSDKIGKPLKEHWQELRSFFTQLGRLTELEKLEIIVESPRRSKYIPRNMSTPLSSLRLLTVLPSLEEEDKETGRQGFLSLLVEDLLWVGIEEPPATLGQMEAEWIVSHWPALEAIELLPEGYMNNPGLQIPKHLEWLRERKPELKLSR